MDVSAGRILGSEGHGFDLGRDLLHGRKGAPVEGLDGGALFHLRFPHHLDHGFRESLGTEGLPGFNGVILVSMLKRTRVFPLFLTRAKTSASVGMRTPSMPFWSGYKAAYGVSGLIRPTSYFCSSAKVREEGWAVALEELAGRVARDLGIEQGVVADHDHAVLGDRAIQFECVDSEAQGSREGSQSVLRPQATSAAMRLQVDSSGRGGWRLGGCDFGVWRERQREQESESGQEHGRSLSPPRAPDAPVVSPVPGQTFPNTDGPRAHPGRTEGPAPIPSPPLSNHDERNDDGTRLEQWEPVGLARRNCK